LSFSGLVNHFGSAANASREKNGKTPIDWKKQLAFGRERFGVKVRSMRAQALKKKKVHPYLEHIGLHNPLQVLVYVDEDKNLNSDFYRAVASVSPEWKANEGIANLLYVSR
jgi:hypothetical protein